ncbi:MAG: hypothetical protein QOE27_2054 [Solirubrobacteraceae bacterium]|nr:hypothetical protein [Solirubrobacteraceae bacterium]
MRVSTRRPGIRISRREYAWPMRRSAWVVPVLLVLCIPAAPAAGRSPRQPSAASIRPAPVPATARSARHPSAASIRPRTFGSCADLVGYARRNLAATRGVPEPSLFAFAQGAPSAPTLPGGTVPGRAPAGSGIQGPQVAANADQSAPPSFSPTNNQEAGVDEPDIVKTDGTTLYTVAQGRVLAVSLGGAAPRLVGTLALGAGDGEPVLLLRGSRLIVISSSGSIGGYVAEPIAPRTGVAHTAIAPPTPYGLATTTVREVDVHDPGAMKVTRTMTVDGAFVDARQNGPTARLVISSSPRAVPVPADRGRAGGWVPNRRFRSALTGRRYVRPVAPCDTIRRPVEFSGLGMLTILTLDLDRGLWTAGSTALMADARVVYGSPTSLYVATQKWIDPTLAPSRLPATTATVIDRFDVSDPARTTLVASGSVPGYLLNRFSLSEYHGDLRVATTTTPIWWGGGARGGATSQSSVTVLRRTGGLLAPVGQVSGLGSGQQIYSVRFVEDTGYVVTFHQVDPLYTIDLRTPTAPRVAGQLELAGYSSYLQLLAPGLLLGIGQDVGQGNEPTGAQLELFDVSDPSAPRLLQKTLLAGGSSEAQYDPHAFLYWPPTGLAVLPVQIYPSSPADGGPGTIPPTGAVASSPILPPTPGFVGAIGYHVDRSGIAEVGRITSEPLDPGYAPAIRRSVVVGNRLLTISDGGVIDSRLDTLAPQGFVAFPPAASPPPIPLAAAPPPLR